ncbi:O-antigen ligase [Methylotenera sp.]|uniref:O-antigen ligase family protein n=1 Tax=Methylotenera sp. TaxID=2051956 RepID=UPI00271FE08A|nr:O-antigen ligase family protein [Methylotenera sp.]MDO9205538.1 O-antigen ligase family protein [Methylotenera sp.]MDP3817742.1 O-antigen ligase family protein [Methylotenera sp.]
MNRYVNQKLVTDKAEADPISFEIIANEKTRHLTMTDYFFLFGICMVVFWAVDPFEWRLGYRAMIKHFPIVAISPAFILALAGSVLFRKNRDHDKKHQDNYSLMITLSVFAVFVTIGSLYAKFVKGIDNGFLTMGLYTLTAPLTAWFVRKSENPVSLIKGILWVYFFWALVAIAMQVVHIGQAGYFHEREHLVIGALVMIYFLAKTNITHFFAMGFIAAAALVAQKNTAYLIMLLGIFYFFLVWGLQHGKKIKDKFLRWAFWVRAILIGGFLATLVAVIYSLVKSSLPTGNPEYRLHTYEIAWNKFLSSPIWGTGFTGAATEKFDLFTVGSSTQTLPTHSDPLDILAQGGLIGFLLWIAIFIILSRQWVFLVMQPDKQLKPEVVPYLHTLYFLIFSGFIVCMFNPILNNPGLAWTFWGSVGALLAVLKTPGSVMALKA